MWGESQLTSCAGNHNFVGMRSTALLCLGAALLLTPLLPLLAPDPPLHSTSMNDRREQEEQKPRSSTSSNAEPSINSSAAPWTVLPWGWSSPSSVSPAAQMKRYDEGDYVGEFNHFKQRHGRGSMRYFDG